MNRVCSMFGQILNLIPRLEFEAAVKQHQAERHARGFSSWTQMIAMLFCQLGHAQSARSRAGWRRVKANCTFAVSVRVQVGPDADARR